eukprot:3499185-Pleurochrysis_carterae.AAC.2
MRGFSLALALLRALFLALLLSLSLPPLALALSRALLPYTRQSLRIQIFNLRFADLNSQEGLKYLGHTEEAKEYAGCLLWNREHVEFNLANPGSSDCSFSPDAVCVCLAHRTA